MILDIVTSKHEIFFVFLYSSGVLKTATRTLSSVGQSNRLITGMSQVRVLEGLLNSEYNAKN